jgi:hypothetical protein
MLNIATPPLPFPDGWATQIVVDRTGAYNAGKQAAKNITVTASSSTGGADSIPNAVAGTYYFIWGVRTPELQTVEHATVIKFLTEDTYEYQGGRFGSGGRLVKATGGTIRAKHVNGSYVKFGYMQLIPGRC